MPTCKECIHFVVCDEIPTKSADDCDFFKDHSRFVELPFQIGDDVYCTGMFKIYKKTVKGIELDDEGIAIVTEDGYCIDSTVCFRSQKEAEKALKEREGNDKQNRPNP